jgi:ABC-2 type transport system ATP-binding protein
MWIIETVNLRKKFGDFVAVDDVNFKVKEGEIFGFLGPNGAGKTTTINMLCTLMLPTSGRANVAGYDVSKNSNEIRENIGVIPQESVLENALTAKENLEFYAQLYHLPKKQYEEAITRLLKLVELDDRANSLVGTFSGGMKRRLEIAKALIHSPKILFLDEPTIGLDPQTRRSIWEYIKELNQARKVTVFITTHYLEEADFLCDRVAIIDHGKIQAINTPAKLKENLVKGSIIDLHVSEGRDRFVKYLQESGFKPQLMNENSIRILVSQGKKTIPQLFKTAENMKIEIETISMHEPSLEDVFIHYTGKAIRDDTEGRSDLNKKALKVFRG